jgi:heme A synthase
MFYSQTKLHKENAMRLHLSAPKEITWGIAVIVGVVGLLINAGVLSIGIDAFLLVAIAFIILAVACWVKGL